ncbi:MAG: dTDP-4-dehydrorhamnose reductase [Cyanobacteria bacterium J06641_5]
MPRILLVGAQGQLGQDLLPLLATQGDLTIVGRNELDLTQSDAIRVLVGEAAPDLIVNAAAYTAVDKAESEPDIAKAVNAEAPTLFAKLARDRGAALIHVSTDYVFDGQKGSPYLESDPTDPLGVYGRTKELGEQGILTSGLERYAIVRTAWVYGALGKGNFVKTMLHLGKDREALNVIADQIGSPTWTQDLAAAIANLGPKIAVASAESGLYHFTNSGVASWYDLAVATFEEARALGFPLQIQTVEPIATADYPTPAQRPAYSVLAGQKLAAVLGGSAPHWRASLRQMLQALQATA